MADPKKDKDQDKELMNLRAKVDGLQSIVRSVDSKVESLSSRLTDHMDREEKKLQKEEKYSRNRMIASIVSAISIILGLLSFFFYFSDKIFEDRKDIALLQTEVHALPNAITLSIIRELKQNWDFYPPERRDKSER